MGGEGFEPSKAVPADLQSVPFGHSGIHPESRQGDSNPQPADYKSAALPIEPCRQNGPSGTRTQDRSVMSRLL